VTVARDPRRIAVLVLLGILAGATAFGLWHVVVGGLINGNPRAAAFGTALALAAGTLLAGSIALIRRRATP
jgi:hypothetical protein